MTAVPTSVVLVTTSQVGTPGYDVLPRAARSIAPQLPALPDSRWLVLLQGVDAVPGDLDLPGATVRTVPDRIGLSAARNLLLAEAGDLDHAVVGFPDDDAWYEPGFLAAVTQAFDADPDLGLWLCRYGSQPTADRPAARRATAADVVRFGSSNTIVVRGPVLTAAGGFDEGLGVGTPAGGGEDTDLAIRCWARSGRAVFVDAPLVGHRDKNPAKRAAYFRSSASVLRTYVGVPGIRREWLRKSAVGLALVARRELQPVDLKALLQRREPHAQPTTAPSRP